MICSILLTFSNASENCLLTWTENKQIDNDTCAYKVNMSFKACLDRANRVSALTRFLHNEILGSAVLRGRREYKLIGFLWYNLK